MHGPIKQKFFYVWLVLCKKIIVLYTNRPWYDFKLGLVEKLKFSSSGENGVSL